MMRYILSTCMVLIGTALIGQNSKLASIYSQIPPPPEKLMCERAESYEDEIDFLGSLSDQLDEMKIKLEEELANVSEKTNITLSAGFPTKEELARVEKLPESEQRAFWQKIEDDQARMQKAIDLKKSKYQSEKASLNKKVAEYQNQTPENFAEYMEIYHNAGEVKSDKREQIESNPSATNRSQQIEGVCVEFCSTVSPILLKRLRYEYAHLKQNMILHRRLSVIELAEYSTLTEEEVSKQNAALLDLNDIEILKQFITNYTGLYDVLPGQMHNQR